MKESFLIATLIVSAAGALGAGAALTVDGSSLLANVETDLITGSPDFPGLPLCPSAAGINYVGAGSSVGENGMIAGTQNVNPAPTFLSSNVCKGVENGGIPSISQAQGLVIGLDALSIATAASTGGAAACNGATGGDNATACTTAAGVPIDPTVGLASSTTVGPLSDGTSYTFNGWRDVLTVLYFGKSNTGTINCNSPIRNYLANNWSSVFENSGCTSASCSQIQHLFRRDDAAGSTNSFSQLLGFSTPSYTGGKQVATAVGTYFFGSDNFCNSAANNGFTSGTAATGWGKTVVGENGGAEQGTITVGSTTVQAGIAANDDQDHDPIRRLCAGSGTSSRVATEQVCERFTYNPNAATVSVASNGSGGIAITLLTGGSGYLATPSVNINGGGCTTPPQATATLTSGVVTSITVTNPGAGCTSLPSVDLEFYQGTLGLLLPVITTASTLAGQNAVQYATNACSGSSSAVSAPLVPSLNSRGSTVLVGGNCPNGDPSINSGNQCIVPFDTTQSPPTPNCLASAGQTPASSSATSQGSFTANGGASGTGPNPQSADGRVYNLWVYANPSGSTTAPVWQVAIDDGGRPLYGAFYRIHSTHTYTSGATPCAVSDADLQSGCLVQASACSFAFTGRASAEQTNVVASKILGVPSVPICVQTFDYQFSRKLYLNTLIGFGALDAGDPELGLAQCEGNPSIINKALSVQNFVVLPDAGANAVNGGNPYIEVFNPQQVCDAGLSVPNGSTVTAPNAGVSLPTVFTECGNGVVEAFENCDPTAPRNTWHCDQDSGSCSSTCRCTL
jgi:hypothetical protein